MFEARDGGPLALTGGMSVAGEVSAEMLDTPQKCLEALHGFLVGSTLCVMRAAEVLVIMEARGYDISSLQAPTIKFLRRVSQRKVLPDVFLAFTGRLRSNVAQLTVAEQRRLLDGGKVPLLILKPEGPEILETDPRKLTPDQVQQVFNGGMIRDAAEQRTYLEDERLKTLNADVTPLSDVVQVAHARGGIIVNGYFINKKELRMYLDDLDRYYETRKTRAAGAEGD